jgi:hypothetical protein
MNGIIEWFHLFQVEMVVVVTPDALGPPVRLDVKVPLDEKDLLAVQVVLVRQVLRVARVTVDQVDLPDQQETRDQVGELELRAETVEKVSH